MASAGGSGALQLLRRPREYAKSEELSDPSGAAVVSSLKATEPTPSPPVVALPVFGQAMDSQASDRASLPEYAVLRHSPEVGAVCGKSARTDLRGGCRETGIPTAIMVHE